jgi:hypothetical protein
VTSATAPDKRDRAGSYRLNRLVDSRGHDAKIIDWLDEITKDCPRKTVSNMNDQCGTRCPDLAAVL